jgi:hypothetical protein
MFASFLELLQSRGAPTTYAVTPHTSGSTLETAYVFPRTRAASRPAPSDPLRMPPEGVEDAHMGSTTTSGQASAEPVSPRFSCDPGKGSVDDGAALAPGASMTAFEGQVGRMGAHRIFATAGQTASLLSQVHDTVAARRFPVVSIKPVGSWKDIAQGRHNPWVDALLVGLGEVDSPLCFTVNHEPENDEDGARTPPRGTRP